MRSSNIDEEYFVKSDDDVFVEKECINIPFVKNEDILITSANGSSRLVGKHAIVDDISSNSAVHGGFMLLASSKNPYFINASMSSPWYKKFIELYVAGGNGAIGNLNKNNLDNYDVLFRKIMSRSKLEICLKESTLLSPFISVKEFSLLMFRLYKRHRLQNCFFYKT